MKEQENKIAVGQIWEVTTETFLTSGDSSKYKRPIKLSKGEKIEIRYPYDWHFRTEDDHYLHAREDHISQNAKLYGIIWEKVRFNNNAKLKEILDLRLFDKVL